MADYGGYFLEGLSSGIQSGINMGQQLQEMRWQKKQRKALEEKQTKMLETANIWNAKVKEFGADNTYSDEEIAQLDTIILSGGYEFMEHYKGAMDAIRSTNKAKYDQELEWMDLFTSGVEGCTPGDIQALYEYVKPNITSEKGSNILEAYNNILQKKSEIANAPKTVTPYEFYGESPAGVQTGIAESVAGQTPGLGGVQFKEPEITETPQTELGKMEETKKWLDAAYATGNATYFNQIAKQRGSPATFDTYKQGYEKPVTGGGGEIIPEKFRVTSLTTLEKYRNNALNTDSWEDTQSIINDYTKAGYDPKPLEEKVNKETWVNVKKSDLDNLVAVLNEITAGTPEGRNVKGKKEFTFNLDIGKGPEEITNTGEEWYKKVYDSYITLLKLLEKEGVDISQYKKLKPLSEIKKASSWTSGFVGSGVEGGDLIKIYY